MAPQQQGRHLHFAPPPGPDERSISSCWVTLVAVKRRAASGSSRNDDASDQDIVGVGDFFAAAFHLPDVRPWACKKYRQTCGTCDVYRQRLLLTGEIRTLVSLLESGK